MCHDSLLQFSENNSSYVSFKQYLLIHLRRINSVKHVCSIANFSNIENQWNACQIVSLFCPNANLLPRTKVDPNKLRAIIILMATEIHTQTQHSSQRFTLFLTYRVLCVWFVGNPPFKLGNSVETASNDEIKYSDVWVTS